MLDESLLQRPAEFKARAYLDSHRGLMVPFHHRKGKRCAGWQGCLARLIETTKPIPDRWWGTNCTKERWEVASAARLRPSAFSVWLWLLNKELPKEIHFSQEQLGKLVDSQRTKVLAYLFEERLVLGKSYKGGSSVVYSVFEEPCEPVLYKRYLRDRSRKKLWKDGRIVYFYGNISEFSRKHGLDDTCLGKLLNGEIEYHKGFRLAGAAKKIRKPKLMLTYQGKTLSLYAWSKETGISYTALRRRVENGWPIEKVLGMPPYPQCRKLSYLGKSQTISEWSKELGIPRRTITTRLFNGASDSEALQPPGPSRPRKTLTYNGVTKEIHEWAIALDLSPGTIEYRIQSGASIEEVLRPHPKGAAKK